MAFRQATTGVTGKKRFTIQDLRNIVDTFNSQNELDAFDTSEDEFIWLNTEGVVDEVHGNMLTRPSVVVFEGEWLFYDGEKIIGTKERPVTVPSAPTGLTVDFNDMNDLFTASWLAGSQAAEYEWEIILNDDVIDSDTTSSLSVEQLLLGLKASTEYTFRVRSKNMAGVSGYVSDTFTTPAVAPMPTNAPTAITNLQAAYNIATKKITATWRGGSGATIYDYYISLDDSQVLSGTVTTQGFTIDGTLIVGRTYTLGLNARNAAGSSGYETTTFVANPLTATTPTGVMVGYRRSTRTLMGNWDDNAADEGILRYEWVVVSNQVVLDTGSTTTSSFSDVVQLTDGQKYDIGIRAVNLISQSEYRFIRDFTTRESPRLATPTNIQATSVTHNTATIGWTAVPNSQGYDVRVYDAGDLDTGFDQTKRVTTGTSVTFFNLDADTQYTISVIAIGDIDNYINSSSGTSTFSTTLIIPTMPTNLNISYSVILNYFAANWNDTPQASHYDCSIIRADTKALVWQKTVTVSDVNQAGIILTNGVQYTFRVRARNNAGNSSNTEKNFTPNPNQRLGNITGFTTVNLDDDSVTLQWNNVIGAREYRIKIGSREFQTVTTNSLSLTGLTPNTRYAVKVFARNTDDYFDGRTLDTSFTTLMPTIKGVITQWAVNKLTLSWSAFSGADSYRVNVKGSHQGPVIVSGTAAQFDIETGITGTVYDVEITAIASNVNISRKFTMSYTSPAVPFSGRVTGLTIDSDRRGADWNDVAGVDGYEYRESNGVPSVSLSGTFISTSRLTNYRVGGRNRSIFQRGTHFCVRPRVNSYSNLPWTCVANPRIPTGLSSVRPYYIYDKYEYSAHTPVPTLVLTFDAVRSGGGIVLGEPPPNIPSSGSISAGATQHSFEFPPASPTYVSLFTSDGRSRTTNVTYEIYTTITTGWNPTFTMSFSGRGNRVFNGRWTALSGVDFYYWELRSGSNLQRGHIRAIGVSTGTSMSYVFDADVTTTAGWGLMVVGVTNGTSQTKSIFSNHTI